MPQATVNMFVQLAHDMQSTLNITDKLAIPRYDFKAFKKLRDVIVNDRNVCSGKNFITLLRKTEVSGNRSVLDVSTNGTVNKY